MSELYNRTVKYTKHFQDEQKALLEKVVNKYIDEISCVILAHAKEARRGEEDVNYVLIGKWIPKESHINVSDIFHEILKHPELKPFDINCMDSGDESIEININWRYWYNE